MSLQVHDTAKALALPRVAFQTLVDALDGDSQEAVLRDAGEATGRRAARACQRELGGAGAETVSPARFWQHVDRLFRSRGWGSVDWNDAHPGIGLLSLRSWPDVAEGRVFSAALFQGFLAELTPGEWDTTVLESNGDRTTLAFGSADTVRTLVTRMGQGQALDEALNLL